MPLRTPQRTNVAALSLRSCLREVLHLQSLRRCFKEKHRHGRGTRQAKAKYFAACNAPCVSKIFNKNDFAFSPCRAWWQDGGRCRKSIDVFLPSLLCSAARKRFPKAAAFGALSWFVLCRVAKNEHLYRTANARSSVSVKRKSCKKLS